eukprot:TRINITY_DN2328_c0_g2_i1.p1 TRINITY_DN2328_c0_g2~~TRINITY_DN2328_c0_g2_i1.p1  ORF type:complete len:125 (-),score=13.65 TRINITY_DN2328_c0_g2_i1:4-378(-)
MPCTEHTDSGLVTVIPCAESPGLELLDWKTFKWEPVEKQGRPVTTVAVLLGETFARLTCMHFQGTVHRVVRSCDSDMRYSLPFQLRAHPSAIIDSINLNSTVVKNIPKTLQEAIRVGDFIPSGL